MPAHINLEQFEPRLKEFYEFRAVELSEDDRAALIRLTKAIRIAAPRNGERILDLGAKQGRLGALVRSQGMTVDYTGFDVSDSNVEAAMTAGFR
ncbi:MAG TPA: hypothetical protein VKI19_10070, partial [Acidimicrobiales bacterium]|nr:hypothetical protein [Acidimicrobiales bacterium]